jgi:putative hydrolase of the HAD superfamily
MPLFPQVLFFDAVGTLFHLRQPVGQTYAEIATEHGVMVDAQALDKGFRAAWKSLPAPHHPEHAPPQDDDRSWWEELVRRTFQHAQPQMPEPAQMAEVFDDLYEHFAHADAWQLWEDTVPVLEKLRGMNRRLIVLSNFDKRLRNILEGLEIGHYFESIIVSSEVGAWKPDPRMFRVALQAARVPADQCLHVGDDPHNDGEGALAMGIPSLLVKRPEVSLRTILEKMAQE